MRVRVGIERTAGILTTLRVLLCNNTVFGRKYSALHFCKAELERELARFMFIVGVLATLPSYFTCMFIILTVLTIDQMIYII
jgi:hypothetical protein